MGGTLLDLQLERRNTTQNEKFQRVYRKKVRYFAQNPSKFEFFLAKAFFSHAFSLSCNATLSVFIAGNIPILNSQ